MERLTTYDPKKDKTILAGYVDKKEKIFVKHVTSRHFFRKLQAYGIQEEIVQELIEMGIKTVSIRSHTLTYESKITDWVNGHCLIRDYGNGLQRFLPVHYMKKKKVKRS